MNRRPKLHKEYCEIEGCSVTDPKLLQHHHIVERKEVGTSNHHQNLAVICANCHLKIHSGSLQIIGVFPSTARNGRTLVYILDGKQNIPDINESYFRHQMPQMKIKET